MRKQAFTRIELIAMLAIVLVLVVLLAPSLQKARERPHRPDCQINFKQIGTAIVMYRDQKEEYPFGRITDPKNPKLIIGQVTPRSALGPDGKGNKAIQDLKIFACPQRRGPIGYQCIDGLPNEDEMDASHAIMRDFETSHGADKCFGFVLRGDMSVAGINTVPGTSWITDPKAQPPLDEDGKTQLGWIDNGP